MDVATFVVTTLGLALAGVGVAVGFRQLKAGIKATKVERVIALHRDLTTGEVGGARDRLTTLMWKHGERRAGRNVCHAPEWFEILPDVLGSDKTRGRLGAYPSEDHIAGAVDQEPMRDLYLVLWCFERIEAGRAGGALDDEMLRDLIASHAVWWNELTRNLTTDHTRHLASLRSLSSVLESPALRSWAAADFE